MVSLSPDPLLLLHHFLGLYYHSGKGLEGCARRSQSVAMPETRQQLLGDPYHKDRFIYDEHSDSFMCPQGQRLQFLRIQRLNGVPWRLYRASEGICQACPAFGVCTKSKEFGRSVTIGPYDAALRRHRVWMSTNEARDAYKRRKPLVEPDAPIEVKSWLELFGPRSVGQRRLRELRSV